MDIFAYFSSELYSVQKNTGCFQLMFVTARKSIKLNTCPLIIDLHMTWIMTFRARGPMQNMYVYTHKRLIFGASEYI